MKPQLAEFLMPVLNSPRRGNLVFTILAMWTISIHGASLPDEQQCRDLWAQQNLIKPEIEGWCLMIDRTKGNCLACHNIAVENWPGNLPTPGNAASLLENIPEKYPDTRLLGDMIADASKSNPETFMPLFGKHYILSGHQIDLIVKYLMSQ